MAVASIPLSVFPPGPAPRRGLVDNAKYYREMLRDSIAFVGTRFAQFGDAYYVPNRDAGLYVLRHPDHIRDVLITHAASYTKTHSGLERLSKVLGQGLLTSDGDVWKRHRRMIQPAFARQRLAEYATTMRDETLRATRSWSVDSAVDVNRAMMELTLHVVSRTLFSHDVTNATDDVSRAMTVLQDEVIGLLPEWVPSPGRFRMRRAIATLDRIVGGMVRDRRSLVASGGAAPSDLLQALVTAVDDEGDHARLSESEVRDELVTLFLAGHETTSQALTWAWYLLARNPNAERTLHAELDSVLAGRAPGYDDLPQLPYTEQVLKEAMRLFPPAYMLARRAQEATQIGEWPVARGSEVVMWIYHTHRDARWFPEPEAFQPERFAPDAEAKLPKLAYVPFGAGARACIGKVFAMIEGQLLLATIAQRYRFELASRGTVRARPRVTLGPRDPLRMMLRAR